MPLRSGCDLRKRNFNINSFRYLPGRAVQAGHPLGVQPLWPRLGLMFSSIQAMSTAGLCHSGQAVRPSQAAIVMPADL